MSTLDQIFSKLPVVLYHEIKTYVHPTTYLNFMNTSKSLFEMVKFETISIKLNTDDTDRFICDQEFHDVILRRIKDPKLQLDLVYMGSDDVSNQLNLEMVSAAKCSKLTIGSNLLGYFYFQDLNQAEVLEGFENINILHIDSAAELRSIRCTNLRELNINFCPKLNDLSGLISLCKIEINYCPALVDVSCLRDVPDLSFFVCPSLTDITALGNARRLTITRCENVKSFNFQSILHLDTDLLVEDSPAISSMKTRSLSIHRYSSSTLQIPSLRTLKIYKSQINTTSHYSNLFEIELENCQEITHLDGLRNVPIVKVIYCANLFDISGLGENKLVKIHRCQAIQSFEPLRGVKRVDLASCSIEDTSIFATVEWLRLHKCWNLKELKGLLNVPHLEVSQCDYLSKKFGNLGNNQFFQLESHSIRKIPASLQKLFPSNRFTFVQNKPSVNFHRYQFKMK